MTLCRLCGAPITQCRPDSLHTGVAPELQQEATMNQAELLEIDRRYMATLIREARVKCDKRRALIARRKAEGAKS